MSNGADSTVSHRTIESMLNGRLHVVNHEIYNTKERRIQLIMYGKIKNSARIFVKLHTFTADLKIVPSVTCIPGNISA